MKLYHMIGACSLANMIVLEWVGAPYEKALMTRERRDWLTGERSIADPYLFVVTRWARAKDVPLAGLDNLGRFVARMEVDSGVHAALAAEETNRKQE